MSKGPNYLIKNGACPAESADDVAASFPAEALFGLKLERSADGPSAAVLMELSPDARAAYEAIAEDDGGLSADEVTARLAWQVQRAAAALFELEASSLVVCRGGRYSRAV
jgi:predicted Rossmann fold nucleotide-binding protein DprA/Smf involved in DNA uptake